MGDNIGSLTTEVMTWENRLESAVRNATVSQSLALMIIPFNLEVRSCSTPEYR